MSTFADVLLSVGGLNVNMLYPINHMNECFETYGLTQIINKPTRVTHHSSTLIDAIFTNATERVPRSRTLNAVGIPDHKFVY